MKAMENTDKSENKNKAERRGSGIDSGLASALELITHSDEIRKQSAAATRITKLATWVYSARQRRECVRQLWDVSEVLMIFADGVSKSASELSPIPSIRYPHKQISVDHHKEGSSETDLSKTKKTVAIQHSCRIQYHLGL